MALIVDWLILAVWALLVLFGSEFVRTLGKEAGEAAWRSLVYRYRHWHPPRPQSNPHQDDS